MQNNKLRIWESKEGFRRLSIFSGIIGLLLWTILFMFGLLESFSNRPDDFYAIGLPISYLIPWLIVKLTKWMLDGFYQKQEIKKKEGE